LIQGVLYELLIGFVVLFLSVLLIDTYGRLSWLSGQRLGAL